MKLPTADVHLTIGQEVKVTGMSQAAQGLNGRRAVVVDCILSNNFMLTFGSPNPRIIITMVGSDTQYALETENVVGITAEADLPDELMTSAAGMQAAEEGAAETDLMMKVGECYAKYMEGFGGTLGAQEKAIEAATWNVRNGMQAQMYRMDGFFRNMFYEARLNDDDDSSMETFLKAVQERVRRLPDLSNKGVPREHRDPPHQPPDFFDAANAVYEKNKANGKGEVAAKNGVSFDPDGKASSLRYEHIKSCGENYLAAARMSNTKLNRAYHAVKANTDASMDFEHEVVAIVAVGVISGSNQKKNGQYHKLGCLWQNQDGTKWADDKLCFETGATWEREAKFLPGGMLSGCETSMAAYNDFLRWHADQDTAADGTEMRGWPWRQPRKGQNSKEILFRKDLPAGHPQPGKYAFFATAENRATEPPTDTVGKQQHAERRRAMQRRQRRTGGSAQAAGGEPAAAGPSRA